MSGLIYLEPRDNPEYFFRQLIHDINTNFSASTSGATTGGGSPIQNGLNTYTGGTLTAQTINVSALTIDNIYVSGNSWFNIFSATTYLGLPTDVYVTGGTYSAGTATFRNSTGGTFSVTGFSNSISFTGTTNYYSKFNSGGTIQNGILYDNGAAGVFIAPSGDNASLSIVSPAGFYYPALGFYNNGGTSLGGISAYAASLYISGAGAPITPIIVSSVVQFPYLYATANTLTYVNAANTLQTVTLGSGLDFSTGGTLSVVGGAGNFLSISGGTVTGATIFTDGVTANTISATTVIFDNATTAVLSATTATFNTATTTVLSATTATFNTATTTVFSATTLTVDTTSNLYGTINTSFTGTASRIVEAASGGTLSSTRELIDSFLQAGTQATLLSTVSNWSPTGVYTGATITGTYQGQQYYNSLYYFVCVDDNDWIRMPRA